MLLLNLFTIEKNMDFILSYNDIIIILYLITIKLYCVFNFLCDIIWKFNFYNIKKRDLIHLLTKGFKWFLLIVPKNNRFKLIFQFIIVLANDEIKKPQ